MDAEYKDPDTLRTLYHEEGMTQTEIADKFNIDDSVISRLFSKHDIDIVYNRSRRVKSRPGRDELVRLYHKERLSQSHIGIRYDVSSTTIRRWLKEEEIETSRPRGKEVIEEIRRLADELNRVPTQRDMKDHGSFSLNCGRRRFGSWNKALVAAGFEPYDATGARNPAWKGGCRKYYGPNWQEQRLQVIIRDQGRCQDCGRSENTINRILGLAIDVHHKTPIKSFEGTDGVDFDAANKVSNLVCLCRTCHSTRERSN